jgi:hypothetical protein
VDEALCRSATAVFIAEIEGTVELYLYCTASNLSLKRLKWMRHYADQQLQYLLQR